ncbi:MAG: substrate-binding domain-containing protein [Planctomycetia bacterium]|nr:substrate-binding domain-containing protein [Planctomycetia bacterium]
MPKKVSIAVCMGTHLGSARKRLYGIMREARRCQWQTTLIRTTGIQAARMVRDLNPDGIIAFLAGKPLADMAREMKIPLIDTAFENASSDYVISLHAETVAQMAMEHFLERGFTHFGYCGQTGRRASIIRRNCFAKVLKTRNLPLATFSQRIQEGLVSLDGLTEWLTELPKPAAVLAFDDEMGERILQGCRRGGITVPEDVAVLGIGNDELMCEISTPTLSSIRFPAFEFGQKGAQLLREAMEGKLEPCLILIDPTDIVVRQSSDTIAISDPVLQKAVVYLRNNIQCRVEEAARILGISRKTLDRRFRQQFGGSANELLQKFRMREASRLLSQTRQPLETIAEICGYTTATSFGRAFLHYFHTTPMAYRETHVILPWNAEEDFS